MDIRSLTDFDKHLKGLTTEDLVLIHRNLFELTERPANDDLIYVGDRLSVLGKALDVFELCVNRLLVDRLMEERGKGNVSR